MTDQTEKKESTYSHLTTAGDRIVRTVSRAVESGNYSNLSADINKELAGIRNDIAKMRNSPYTAPGPGPSNAPFSRPSMPNPSARTTTTYTARSSSSNTANGHTSTVAGTASTVTRTGPSQAVRRTKSAAPRPGSTPEDGGQPVADYYSKDGRNIRIVHRANIPTAVTAHKSGTFKAGFMQYAGGLMTIIFGLSTIINLTNSPASPGAALAAGIFAGLFGFITYKGTQRKKLEKMFRRYARLIGEREFIDLDDLATAAMEPVQTTAANIKLLIKKGVLEGAALDDHEKTLILTRHAYQYYRQAQEEADRRNKALQGAAAPKPKASAAVSSEPDSLISEGKAFIKEIRDINDKIPGEEMSRKLYKLEEIVNKIFDRAEQHPENASALRKFMNYYLPTTRKLLYAYVDLDAQPVQGDNIRDTKREIESAVDTINTAFENLLDSLFSDVAMDISSDISVMKTMMAQDGLASEGTLHSQSTAADALFGSQKAKETVTVNAGAVEAAPKHLEEGN